MLKDREIPVPDQWYLHKIPKKEGKVVNVDVHTELMWDITIRVDFLVEANGPTFILLDSTRNMHSWLKC
eukprot:8594728-Ditylum_brightwellii.AAC.1